MLANPNLPRSSKPRWCLVLLAALVSLGCVNMGEIGEQLRNASAAPYERNCPDERVYASGGHDCDGLPIYVRECGGEVVASGAFKCHLGHCYEEQIPGRCFE